MLAVSISCKAEAAEPMITEYIIKPIIVMLTVNTISMFDFGMMSLPMPVVTSTAQNKAVQY